MKLGFMQGRLSPIINGKIQCFPAGYWEEEFPQARELGLGLMEWTLDIDQIYENPLMTPNGQEKIKSLMSKFDLEIPSLTGDFLMQFPFYKLPDRFEEGRQTFLDVLEACGKLKIRYLVFPLVDNGRLENQEQEDILVKFCRELVPDLEKSNVQIVFESDYPPPKLKALIERLPAKNYGINFDMGNSAALGFDVSEEFQNYGSRVYNIHVKDRVLGGTTVPLGTGNADFKKIFKEIKKSGYQGHLIFQTARAQDGDHKGALVRYREFIQQFEKELM